VGGGAEFHKLSVSTVFRGVRAQPKLSGDNCPGEGVGMHFISVGCFRPLPHCLCTLLAFSLRVIGLSRPLVLVSPVGVKYAFQPAPASNILSLPNKS